MNNEKYALVSVIIPVYNAQDYLKVCIDSILNQTYQFFEIICVDDGSSDLSGEMLKRIAVNEPRLTIITTENRGQGAARNLALKHAKGEYVLFVDADDFIDSKTLEYSVARAEKDHSDVVVFDWRYYYPNRRTDNYFNGDSIFSNYCLKGDECLKLLASSPIFSVNKMYRKSLLDNYDISYGEGYLYEDNPFQFKVILNASIISLLQIPFYRVTVSDTSSTKTNHDTNIHCDSYIKAVHECLDLISKSEKQIDDYTMYSLMANFFDRFIIYYNLRTPDSFKKRFADDFVKELSVFDVKCYNEKELFDYCLKYSVFSDQKSTVFKKLVDKHIKKTEKEKSNMSFKKRIKRMIISCIRLVKPSFRQKNTKPQFPKVNFNKVILFMGFDYKYTGNSKYLFEDMIKNKPLDRELFFATDDPRVPLEYRVSPDNDYCKQFVKKSKVVIFESWTQLKYVKPQKATWIQLWHGTAIKKIGFSSHEKAITEINPKHKTRIYKDTRKWDYLLADCSAAVPYFEDAFMTEDCEIIPYGYPRVNYLKKNKDNEQLKSLIKEIYDIPDNKKLVLYMPTWRDYNYGKKPEKFDLDYLLDLKSLSEKIGDDFYILYKDHPYLSNPDDVSFKNYCDAESQELLLVADYFITDYSSALFDALAVDIPVLLYCNDFERNEAERGVYPSVWNDLLPFVCDNEDELVKKIKKYDLNDYLDSIKSVYTHPADNNKELIDLIVSI